MNPLLDFLIEAVSIVRSADARAAQTGINVACLATSSTQAEVILRESDLVRRFLALHPASQDVIESGKDPLQKERDDLAKFRKKMAARREKKRKEEERKKRLYSSGDGRAKKK
jgi:glycerol-3-phosphate cytidylyltransferase-like family protein